mgnify:CR=1 FL=1
MLWVTLFLGVLFFSLGFVITEQNASTLLSGYNTMSEEEQAAFPLKTYLKAFKRFHIRFGIFFTVFGTVLWFFSKEYAGYHLGITPILAYLVFFYQTKSLTNTTTNKRLYRLGTGVLIVTLIFIIGLFAWSERTSELVIESDQIAISGPYGVDISFSEIDSVALTEFPPEITVRLHGIATGKVSKGKFKGPNGSRFLTLIEHPADQYLFIYRTKDTPVIIALDSASELEVYERLKKLL